MGKTVSLIRSKYVFISFIWFDIQSDFLWASDVLYIDLVDTPSPRMGQGDITTAGTGHSQ